LWPPNREAFDEYWRASLDKTHIDDTVREFLYPIAAGQLASRMPRWIRAEQERIALVITTGFLPQRFRDEMRLPWDDRRQRHFDRLIAVLRLVNRLAPRFVRQFPFNALLVDLNWRIRTGRPLV
jgi:uncharacterized protein (DUF2236 family)